MKTIETFFLIFLVLDCFFYFFLQWSMMLFSKQDKIILVITQISPRKHHKYVQCSAGLTVSLEHQAMHLLQKHIFASLYNNLYIEHCSIGTVLSVD